jgi:hypothetical protein
MSNEIIEAEYKNVSNVSVSDHSINALGERIEKMKAFVNKQMVKGIDNDYAIIPGTNKNSLLKPGVEKLLLLFNLGFKFTIISQVIDFHIGEISFLIECKVFRKGDGVVVGEYMGYCSNKEKKYIKLNPADIVNTILKMCQKRALVGATIAATGASDYFTQDLEDMDRSKIADKNKFQNRNTSNAGDYVVKGGKFDGKAIKDIPTKDLSNYVEYIAKKFEEENKPVEGELKKMIDNAREHLRAA